jgi:hypothetical protein
MIMDYTPKDRTNPIANVAVVALFITICQRVNSLTVVPQANATIAAAGAGVITPLEIRSE